jgi:hypothetical protein
MKTLKGSVTRSLPFFTNPKKGIVPMKTQRKAALLLGAVLALALVAAAYSAEIPALGDGFDHGDPPFLLEDGWQPLINGKNMDGWTYVDPKREGTWMATRGVYWSAKAPKALVGRSEPGDRIVNTAKGTTASNLMCAVKMSDFELYIEFMIPANSNSGVYLHGLYEMQIWDSYGIVPRLDTDRTGALYHYQESKTLGVDGGTVPLVRAEYDHGQWNAYHVWYKAPRFDANGKKTENAMVLRALLNGRLIHENQPRLARTVAAPNMPEATVNPVCMLQGDHGSVAFRNAYVRPLRPLPPIPASTEKAAPTSTEKKVSP